MLFYIVTAIILFFYFLYPKSKWEAAVILFVAFIMQGALLKAEDQLFGFIDQRAVVTLIVIYTAYKTKLIVIPKFKWDIYKKTAFFLAVFLVIILARYTEIKSGLLFDNLDLGTQVKRLIRDGLIIYAIYLIFKRLYNLSTLQGIENGLLLGVVLAVVSMLFYDFFLSLGFRMHIRETASIAGGEYFRLSGFIGDNANNTAGLLNVVAGYVYAKMQKSKNLNLKYLTLLGLILIGQLHLASRAGIITFLILTTIFVFLSNQNFERKISYSLLIALLGILIYTQFGDFAGERISRTISGEQAGLEVRQSYWLMYLMDLYHNPEYLLIGNLGEATYHRDVHNTYIQYLFGTGIFAFLAIIIMFWRIYKNRKKYIENIHHFNALYPLLTLMISWITGAGQINFWFIIIIAASPGIPQIYFEMQHYSLIYKNKVKSIV